MRGKLNINLLKSIIKKTPLYKLLKYTKHSPQLKSSNDIIQLAEKAIKAKDWDYAIKSLNAFLQQESNKARPEVYFLLGKAWRFKGQYDAADEILETGLERFPGNIKIKTELAEVAMADKDWKEAVQLWQDIEQTKKGSIPVRNYLRLNVAYQKLSDFDLADKTILRGMEEHPHDLKLATAYAELAMIVKDWEKAAHTWQKIYDQQKEDTPTSALFDLAITQQILGNVHESEAILNKCLEERLDELTQIYKDGYKKIILFDNGESRIEFYKMIKKPKTVCLTFDSRGMTWGQEPFGFRFLLKQNVDIIATRRRTKKNYHQDLSREDFVQAVDLPTRGYEKKFAYGFSLGGYTSLYYGSSLNCDILSLSPRNSAHPIYGAELDFEIEFKHPFAHPVNPNIRPIIVYDPKDKIDNRYVEEVLLPAYPNGQFVKCYYTGHRAAPYFSQIGILKAVVLSALNGEEMPDHKGSKRWNSNQYLRVLGNACLRRNKVRWALALGERAVELDPKDYRAALLKVKATDQSGRSEEAIALAEEAVINIPKNIKVRTLLIDLLIKSGDLEKARKATSKALKCFKDAPELKSRRRKIKKLTEELVTV